MRADVRRTFLAAVVAVATAMPALAQESRRDEWQKVDEIFKAMGVRPGAVVADIGAGGGFFTTRLSRAVGAGGRVYAVDVDRVSLGRLRQRLEADGVSNVEIVESAHDDPKLAPGTLDAALIVNAYHEMKEHQAMLTKIRAALKPDGRLVVVEPITPSRRAGTREEQVQRHEIGINYVQQEARNAGFRTLRSEDPFTTRTSATEQADEEWILVLTPLPAAPPPAAEKVPSIKDDEWKSPDLRISVEEFKRLVAAGAVLVVDARDAESYRAGHLPNAVLITPEEVFEGNGAETLRSETRAIVAYCS